MLFVIIVNILAIFLVYCSGYRHKKSLYGVAFAILIFFYGIRRDYGNDYGNYEYMFNIIASSNSIMSLEGGHYEMGWLAINKFFSFAPFPFFVFVLTIIQFLPVYILLKKYVSPEFRYLGLAVFLFDSSLLVCLSMMRQALAGNLILLAFPFLEKKKRWPFFLGVVFLAAQIHTSAYIMALAPLITFIAKLNTKKSTLLFMSVFVLFFYISTHAEALLTYLFEYEDMGRYERYLDAESHVSFGISFVLHIAFCYFIINKGPVNQPIIRLYTLFYPIAYIFTSLNMIVQGTGRLAMYFSSIYFVILPYLWLHFKRNSILFGLLILILLIDSGWDYFTFFFSPVYGKHYIEYHTIFDF